VGATLAVEGKITVDRVALSMRPGHVGKIWFYPDPNRGNRCPQVGVGNIDEQGTYRLFTRDAKGAAPGWYKIMIVAMDRDSSKEARPLVPWKYTTTETSGLALEVVEQPGPGAYDLHLKRGE
jgi:hypothetical protein